MRILTFGGITDQERKYMFRRLKELYQEYKPYIRVDIIMYAVLILMIILYFIITVAVS